MIRPVKTARRGWPAVALLAVVLLAVAMLGAAMLGCSEQSPNIGKYYKGRILHISVADLERTDELRWTTAHRNEQGAPVERFYRITPQSDDHELTLLRVKVENHTATNAIVNIDSDAAQLRDFLRGRYRPIDVSARAEEVGVPENPADACNVPVNPERLGVCVEFLWNLTYEEDGADGQKVIVLRAQEIPNGNGLDGWLVFETPEDTPFRSFRWSAGDTVTIDF